eukprot:14756443-Alexandrium_andersonii.AAC.1
MSSSANAQRRAVLTYIRRAFSRPGSRRQTPAHLRVAKSGCTTCAASREGMAANMESSLQNAMSVAI